jgi:hypothetical protein
MSNDPQPHEESGDEPHDDPPGPTDHGGQGGMATREVAPDVAEPDAQEPPD